MSEDSKADYFGNVDAMQLGKRRMSRLETKRVLKSIARQNKGFDTGWVDGSASFMKSYPIKQFPSWFAKKGDKVEIEVSIRLLLGDTPEECPIKGLSGLEVYYRFKKTLAKIKTEVADVDAEEKTEAEQFDSSRDIVETSEWRGSVLVSSSMAIMFYRLLQAIGEDKVQKVMNRIKKRSDS
jgi:hypothetical protein